MEDKVSKFSKIPCNTALTVMFILYYIILAGPEAAHKLWGEANPEVNSVAVGGGQKTTGLPSEESSVKSEILIHT